MASRNDPCFLAWSSFPLRLLRILILFSFSKDFKSVLIFSKSRFDKSKNSSFSSFSSFSEYFSSFSETIYCTAFPILYLFSYYLTLSILCRLRPENNLLKNSAQPVHPMGSKCTLNSVTFYLEIGASEIAPNLHFCFEVNS